MASDSTGWPLLEEGRPLGHIRGAAPPVRARRQFRPGWLLAALAFLCGGLVSAAVFTVGWRHQAQRGTAAEAALATATAHEHKLAARLAATRRAEARDRRAAAHERHVAAAARATAASLAQAAAAVAAQAGVAGRAATPLTSGAAGLSSSAAKIASELKTLTTYLTTTPSGQIDSGYVASQTAYLAQQLDDLRSRGAGLGGSADNLTAALQKLRRLAHALNSH